MANNGRLEPQEVGTGVRTIPRVKPLRASFAALRPFGGAAHAIALEPEARADAVVAVYELLDRERAPATTAQVTKLIEALEGGGTKPTVRDRERNSRT